MVAIVQTNIFTSGLDLDTDKKLIKNDRTTQAKEVEYSTTEESKNFSVEPFKNTELGFVIPDAEKSFQVQRLEWKGAGTYSFDIYNDSGEPIIGAPVVIAAPNFAALSGISFLFSLYGYTVTLSALDGNFYTFTLYKTLGALPITYKLVYSFNSTTYPTFTIQDAVVQNTALLPLYTNNIQDVMVVFSCGIDAACDEIGMARKENGAYTYTRILRTNRLGFSDQNVFRIKLENQANDFYGVYWTDRERKPKVVYFPRAYTEDCAMKYTPSDYNEGSAGYYTLSSLDATTNLQLYNNLGRIEYYNQFQTGGYLLAGGYKYAVRFGFKGTQNVTPFSYLSQNIPVFKTSIDSESAYSLIQGDVSGTPTNKANVLLVQGCQAEVFSYVEIACVYNANGVDSSYIFNRFDITGDTMQVVHYGNETYTQELDINLLIDVSEVILKSGDIEIKKNRLNLANNTVAVDDSELPNIISTWLTDSFENALVCERKELNSVGQLTVPGLSNVVQARVQIGTDVPLAVSNTLVYPQEILDLYNEYNPITGVYTINTPGVTNVTLSTSFNFVFVGDFNSGSRSTCYRIDFTLFRNGAPIANATRDGLNLGLSATLPNATSVFYTSSELFGNETWVCQFGDTFTLSCRLYGSNLNAGGIRFGSLSFFNASYIDSNLITDFQDTRPGEYQLPENVAKYTGYMYRDRYPFYFRFHMDNEYITKPMFVATFGATPTDFPQGIFTNDNSFNDIKIYAYHAVLNNLPIASLRQAGVKGISVWRGLSKPNVLGSGVYMTSDQTAKGNFNAGYYCGIPVSNGYYGTLFPSNNVARRMGMLLSPDIQDNKTNYSGGTLVVHGTPSLESFGQKTILLTDSSANQRTGQGNFAQYKGFKYSAGFDFYPVINGQYCEFNIAYNTPFSSPAPYAPSTYYNMAEAGGLSTEVLALQTDDPVNTANGTAAASDNGLFLAQYEVENVIDTLNIKCVPTGCFIEINDNTPDLLSGIQVFGGDTYTQKSIRRLCYGVASRNITDAINYSFITYYAQNRVNTQLFYTDKAQPPETYNLGAAGSVLKYLFPAVASNSHPQEQFNRDLSYTAPNIVNQISPYNSANIVNSVFGSRIWYSDEKPTGSVYDFYRQIKPFSFKDLDAKDGSIIALCDVNDVMIAIQPNAVSVLPYQSDVALATQGSSAVYTGSGGVYAQREEKKSIFGASIRTGVHLAKNENGNDILFWYSDQYHKMMKFSPGDGVRTISEENNVRSWFLNQTRNITRDFDIVLGYNIQLAKLYITSRAINKTIPNWNPETEYPEGDVVNYQVEGSQNTFEYLPNIYQAATPNTGVVPFGNDDTWDYIVTTNNEYYNYWTLVYSEKYRAFTTFTINLPRRYFDYMEWLLSPRSLPSYNRVYQMDAGSPEMKYFEEDGQFNQGQFELAIVVNKGGSIRKKYRAITMDVGEGHINNPIATVTTEIQNSTTLANEMELRGPDLCFSVRTDGLDRPIISGWAEIKIVNTLYMRISNFITTFVTRTRTPYQ